MLMPDRLNSETRENRSKADGPPRTERQPSYYVLGGQDLGVSVTRHLRDGGYDVGFVDEMPTPEAVPGHRGNPGDVDVLATAGIGDASAVIVLTPKDSRNLLIAQIVRSHFDVPEILVLVNRTERYDAIADTGYEPICVTDHLAGLLTNRLADRTGAAEQPI